MAFSLLAGLLLAFERSSELSREQERALQLRHTRYRWLGMLGMMSSSLGRKYAKGTIPRYLPRPVSATQLGEGCCLTQ